MEDITFNTQNCLNCDKLLHGNRRKKFCDSTCRLSYSRQMKMLQDDQTKDILVTLRANSSILKNLLGKEKNDVVVNKNELLEAGFRFNYITDSTNTEKGGTVYFCYGYAYFILENDQYLIARRKDVPE